MKEIIAYEMSFCRKEYEKVNIECIPFQKKFWNEYMKIYNECFYEMRKDLEIEPFHFYSDYSQMQDKADNTFLYVQNGKIVGAVSCYGNEIDDLIVNKDFQRNGWGKQLLLWGIDYMKKSGYEEIVLHVAEWNKRAIELYLKTGFVIRKKEKVR